MKSERTVRQVIDSCKKALRNASILPLSIFQSALLNKLFESTAQLDDVALHHVIAALCKLSSEGMTVRFQKLQS